MCADVTDYHAVGVGVGVGGASWKRAEPAAVPLDMGIVSKTTSSSRPLVGATGRNNWFAKSVSLLNLTTLCPEKSEPLKMLQYRV